MSSQAEKAETPRQRYPWYIIFILGNEFCERFTYYGMKTVLTLYFAKVLLWNDDRTTFFYHFFSLLCYFFPIFGAWLADGLIGKFHTILWLSLVYILGLIVLTIGAIPILNVHVIAATLSGLLLIAIGTGGIKPCVSTYGADQFKPGQETQRESFFSYFYFCINAGSLISTFVTPILRSEVHCFGSKTCYSLAFGVPAALMAVALLLFLFGKPFYTETKPNGSLISRVFMCISHAVYNNIRGKNKSSIKDNAKDFRKQYARRESNISLIQKFKRRWSNDDNSSEKPHWLDSASDKYDKSFIEDIKQLLRVLFMFLPIPMFWALFDQQGSRWTLQASRMDGRLTDTYAWQPDQVQIFNPVLILLLVPFFEWAFYPLLRKLHIPFRLLARMTVGMVLAGVAFVIAAFVQIALAKTLPVLPGPAQSELHIYNANPCSLRISGDLWGQNATSGLVLKPYDALDLLGLDTAGYRRSTFAVSNVDCISIQQFPNINVDLNASSVYSVFLYSTEGRLGSKQIVVSKEKPEDGNAKVYFLIPFPLHSNGGEGNITLIDDTIAVGKDGHETVLIVDNNATTFEPANVEAILSQAKYSVYVSNDSAANGQSLFGSSKLSLANGGVYTVILRDDGNNASFISHNIVEPNSLSIFWQFPQYFVITVAEVFLSISGLSFAYSEAPESMKSVLQAAWLLTSAFGSVIVMIFSGAHLIQNQAVEFFVFAGLIGIFAVIFSIMAKFYHYKESGSSAVEMTDRKQPGAQDRHDSIEEEEPDQEVLADESELKK